MLNKEASAGYRKCILYWLFGPKSRKDLEVEFRTLRDRASESGNTIPQTARQGFRKQNDDNAVAKVNRTFSFTKINQA